MNRFIRSKLSFANVMSMVALLVALGGTSYAAATLGRNSVGSREIRRHSVKRSDIARNAVASRQVKDRSLRAIDFKPGQLPAGEKGDKGDTGERGAQGDRGATGVVGTTVIRRLDHTLADGRVTAGDEGNVECQPGETPIGGGANLNDIDHGDAKLTGSGPRTGTVAAPTVPVDGGSWSIWRGTAFNPAGGDVNPVTVRVYIICATS